jgi:hypothetical protein
MEEIEESIEKCFQELLSRLKRENPEKGDSLRREISEPRTTLSAETAIESLIADCSSNPSSRNLRAARTRRNAVHTDMAALRDLANEAASSAVTAYQLKRNAPYLLWRFATSVGLSCLAVACFEYSTQIGSIGVVWGWGAWICALMLGLSFNTVFQANLRGRARHRAILR